jgi:hypothetical protein
MDDDEETAYCSLNCEEISIEEVPERWKYISPEWEEPIF